jgi:hypothetical protein
LDKLNIEGKGDWVPKEDTYVPCKVGVVFEDPILYYVIGQRKGLGGSVTKYGILDIIRQNEATNK